MNGDSATLKEEIKTLMVEKLMLQTPAAEIGDEQTLFGPEGLGLDSIDALELVVALERAFGLSIQNSETAAKVLHSVQSIADHVELHRSEAPAS